MIVLTKTFIPYEQFDLDLSFKVTAAILNLILADLNCGTNLLQASYQAVMMHCVQFSSRGSTNLYGPRS